MCIRLYPNPSTKTAALCTHFCLNRMKKGWSNAALLSVWGAASRESERLIGSQRGLSFHSGLSFGLCKCLVWSVHWSVYPKQQPLIRRCPPAHHRWLTVWFHSTARFRRERNRKPTRWTGKSWSGRGSGRRLRSLGTRMRHLSSRWRMGSAFGNCPCHRMIHHRDSWANYY